MTSERDRSVPFLLAALLAAAAAIRVAVNNVAVYSRADETVYLLYTKALVTGRGYRSIVERYLGDPGMWVFPHPLRWSWLGATSLFAWLSGECTHRTLATVSTVAGIAVVGLAFWIARELFGNTAALVAAALAATSPLQLALGRRALADEFVCAAVLASIAALLQYLRGRRIAWLVVWIAATTVAIAAKELFLFSYPLVLGFWWLRARKVRWYEAAAWLAPPLLFFAVFCILARDVTSFFEIARLTASTATAAYPAQYQSGPPHRLLIDLMAVAPIVTVVAIAALVSAARAPHPAFGHPLPAGRGEGHSADVPRESPSPRVRGEGARRADEGYRHLAALVFAMLAVHAILPSQNLRYIAAAEPLLRILAAAFLVAEVRDRRWLAGGLLVNAAVEWMLFYTIFIRAEVYDPVTDHLLRALKMLPR